MLAVFSTVTDSNELIQTKNWIGPRLPSEFQFPYLIDLILKSVCEIRKYQNGEVSAHKDLTKNREQKAAS